MAKNSEDDGSDIRRSQEAIKDDIVNTSQSQNNNGNIGREVDNENDENPFWDIGSLANESPPNENGIAENEENHSIGNSSEHNEIEKSQLEETTKKHPKKGYNHADNIGGTSQEDLENKPNDISREEEEDDDGYGL